MSAPDSGKFQDHYIVLGIEPRADSETIQGAYGKLAQKYHPNNPETGSQEKFDAVNLAYEILSDPSLRIEFDKLKGIDHDAGEPKFTGVEFFDALEQGTALRSALLCILYDRRRTRSFKPSLSMRHLEGMLHVTAEELNFALWYLKQRGLVVNDDKSSLQITVVGMDYLEQNRPSAGAVMPLIKPEALSQPKPQSALQPEKLPATEAKAAEPVLNVLNRALQRSYVPEEAPAASRK
jgi:curved DNA-binding protein CbpA